MKFKKVIFIALSALVVPNLNLLFAEDPATVQQQPLQAVQAETIIPAPTAAAPVTITPTTEVKTTVPAEVEEEEEVDDVDDMYADFQKELTAALESIKTQGAIEAAPTPVETQPATITTVQPTTTPVAETQTAPAAVESTQG